MMVGGSGAYFDCTPARRPARSSHALPDSSETLAPTPGGVRWGSVAKEAATFVRFAALGGCVVQVLGSVWDSYVMGGFAAAGVEDEYTAWAAMTYGAYVCTWGLLLVCLQVLGCGVPMPRAPHQVPTAAQLAASVRASCIGHLFTTPLLLFVVLPRLTGIAALFTCAGGAGYPTFSQAAWEIFVSHFTTELFFYGAHSLLHHPALYSTFHKRHHEFSGPVVTAAEHSSLLESVVNTLCTFAGPLCLGRMHASSWVVFFVADMWGVYERHSGRDLSYTLPARLGLLYTENAWHHDKHHTANTGNYGHQLFDHLFGTFV